MVSTITLKIFWFSASNLASDCPGMSGWLGANFTSQLDNLKSQVLSTFLQYFKTSVLGLKHS